MSIINNLKSSEIIPDVISSEADINAHSMNIAMTIKYPSGAKVENGKILKLKETQAVPEVVFSPPLPTNGNYVMVMTDPDAPSRSNPVLREFCHWVVTSIIGSKVDRNARQLVPYFGPSPPEGTGFHRYIFLLFRNRDPTLKITNVLKDKTSRRNFKVMEWAKKNDLELVSINFFQTQRS